MTYIERVHEDGTREIPGEQMLLRGVIQTQDGDVLTWQGTGSALITTEHVSLNTYTQPNMERLLRVSAPVRARIIDRIQTAWHILTGDVSHAQMKAINHLTGQENTHG